jgi:hypothetical protein
VHPRPRKTCSARAQRCTSRTPLKKIYELSLPLWKH